MKERGILAKLAIVPVVTAAAVFGGVESANRYSDDEIERVKLWAEYEPNEFLYGDELLRERITFENAHKFLSIDDKVKVRGYITQKIERGKPLLTTRISGQEIYGVNLVIDALGEQVIIDNQRGLLNLMRLKQEFEDGDKRLIAFAMIVSSGGGYEARSNWNNEESSLIIDAEENKATVSFWKVYAEGSYPTGRNLLTQEDRAEISEYYVSTEAPLHGKVYRVEAEIDLHYLQDDSDTITATSEEFVGIDWHVWNK